MGTKVQYKSSFPRHYSMREVNDDSNSSSWPLFYGDKALASAHHHNGFVPRTVTHAYQGHEKDALKHKMLEHEAIFKNQVYELHRVYRRQQDVMGEVKHKDLHKNQVSVDALSSSSHMPSQNPYEDAQRWHVSSFPGLSDSPLSCSKANSSKEHGVFDFRPSKARKKLFDLQRPPDEYIDLEEEQMQENQASEISSSHDQRFKGSSGLADLNEPLRVEEVHAPPCVEFLGHRQATFERPRNGLDRLPVDGKGNGRDRFSYMHDAGSSRSLTSFDFKSDKERQLLGKYSEISARFQNHSVLNQTHLPFATPRKSGPHQFENSSDMADSWSPSAKSWRNPNVSLTHKLTSFPTHFQPARNGFDYGSWSGSKEPSAHAPLAGFGLRNGNKLDDGSRKVLKSSNFVDLTDSTTGIDLNTVQISTNEDDDTVKRHQTALPWLKNVKSHGVSSALKNDSSGNDTKILGVRIFGNSCVSKIGSSSPVSTSASVKTKPVPRGIGIDINVACDDDEETEIRKVKNHFDLNSCVTEDENLLAAEAVRSSGEKGGRKVALDIDLEAPAAEETGDDEFTEWEPENPEPERAAVEAMVAISGHLRSMADVAADDDNALVRFAELITSGVDEFESLTLQLEETKEEDYMPKPIAPDFFDGTGPSSLPVRPRRGQARRGRPRRDFQRDILPGLVPLSRHELTEDLQIFGELMKATGHVWNVPLTKKKGNRRGRRKAVAATPLPLPPPPPPPLTPLFSEAMGLEERSLTGWGKTTRRPRRQRCVAGSSVTVNT